MAEVKRWSVTYTKYMKQKRKVYQDGSLELNASTNKMTLFDDCEKLLECRILKKDEVVSSGETLTFNSFLVDVNEAYSVDGDRKPVPAFNSQAKDEKRAKPFVISRNKPQISLSPSQKIIREFKSRGLHKYGAVQSSPEMTKASKTEWQVLYTTQLTQKAKKYHDGFLQFSTSGSYGKQIILLDASRNQLDCRFLKKDEVVASGESIRFDAHLIEIGEREGDRKPVADLHLRENKRNVVGEAGIKLEQGNGVITDKASGKEWKVLYTTQITQKAKKYHDGFLKLAMCVSQRRQAMLFDATRKLIDSKFLKKDEVVTSGKSFAFDAHLVDVGEPEGNHELSVDIKFQGNSCYQKSEKLGAGDDCVIVNDFEVKEWNALYTTQITQKAKKYHAGILRVASSGSYSKKVSLLSEDKTLLSSKITSLSEDIRPGCIFELPKYLVETGIPYASSGGEGKSQNKDCLKKDSDSKLSISSVEETKPSREVPTNKPLRDAHQIMSILQKPMSQERIISDHDNNSTARPVDSTKGSRVSDAVILELDSSEGGRPSQLHRAAVKIEPGEKMDTGNPPDVKCSKGISGGRGSQVAEGINIRKDQHYSGNVEADTKQRDRAYSSDKSSLSSCASHDAADEKRTRSEEPVLEQIKVCPSFDLGF